MEVHFGRPLGPMGPFSAHATHTWVAEEQPIIFGPHGPQFKEMIILYRLLCWEFLYFNVRNHMENTRGPETGQIQNIQNTGSLKPFFAVPARHTGQPGRWTGQPVGLARSDLLAALARSSQLGPPLRSPGDQASTPRAPGVIQNIPRAPGVNKNVPWALGVMKNYPRGPAYYQKYPRGPGGYQECPRALWGL